MTYWSGIAPSTANLRLFEPDAGWRQYDDQKDPEGNTTFSGSGRSIDLSLSTALNASNLILLTGPALHCVPRIRRESLPLLECPIFGTL
jgi:hypothetical protein